MTTKIIETPDTRLGESLDLAERRRLQANEAERKANAALLLVEEARAAQAEAERRAQDAERVAADLKQKWNARETEFEAAVKAGNEAAATAAQATAALEAAEGELARLRPLLSEAEAQLARLEPENRQLREKVAAFESRVEAAERRLRAAAGQASETLQTLSSAAIESPNAESVPDLRGLIQPLQSALGAIQRAVEPRDDSEYAERARADREAAIRRRSAEASERLEQAIVDAVGGLSA